MNQQYQSSPFMSIKSRKKPVNSSHKRRHLFENFLECGQASPGSVTHSPSVLEYWPGRHCMQFPELAAPAQSQARKLWDSKTLASAARRSQLGTVMVEKTLRIILTLPLPAALHSIRFLFFAPQFPCSSLFLHAAQQTL